jgi:uncharacterized membrane protein YraQ (UPF0718 family)
MIILVFTLALGAITVLCGYLAWRRGPAVFHAGLADAKAQFIMLLPRLAVGILGSGFLAHILPKEVILQWFGPNSGITGTALASLAGALTPGGPVVGYAIGAASLKAGADLAQVVAYVTAWSLFTFNRIIAWEITSMPLRMVLMRIAVSLPFPFLAAGITMLIR